MTKSGKFDLAVEANEKIAEMVKEKTTDTLTKVLAVAGENMKNGFKWSDN